MKMRQWNKETIEEQLKLHKKQNKDDRYNYMNEQFNVLWYCWELEKYTIEKDKEIEKLNNIIDELEKWCDIQFQVYKDLDKVQDSRISCQYLRMKDKLKELKNK